jgi:hypothetical protein
VVKELRSSYTVVDVVVYPTYDYGPGRRVKGRTLRFAGVIPAAGFEVDYHFQEIQFIGVHNCLVLTILLPHGVRTLYQVAKAIPRLDYNDRSLPVTWCGPVRQWRVKHTSGGLKFYIPAKLWNPPAPLFESKTIVEGYIQVFSSNRTPPYVILTVPSITKETFKDSFK